jgi:hypothetical protein
VLQIDAAAMTPIRFGVPLPDRDARWAVQQASRAPSIHNTQPWRFIWENGVFEVYADTARGLTASDPDGRELVMSCGAALFNLRLGLRKLGYEGMVIPVPDPREPRLLARVEVSESSPADVDERLAFAAMTRRHTHRGAFDDRPLRPDVTVALQWAAENEGAQLVLVADPGQRRRVLSLARAAERALVNDLDVQAEINDWTPSSASRRADGVPVTAYAAEPVASPDDLAPRDFDQGRGAGVGEAVENTPGVIAVLVTEGDRQADWLQAGQALESVLVCAAQRSAYAALHSQLTEVAPLRSELRRELRTSGYPQILMRFGHAPAGPPTPRRPVDEVLQLP